MKKPKSMDYMKYERSMGMNRTPDKQEQLAKKVKHLESERQEMIDALREVQESHVMSDGLTLVSDQTKDKIKTALRNAGVMPEDL